ncbi:hypothetical protein GXY_04252 [Novacetimonas hansenii ATCC 23769]|uniref:Uncharacterized protein n=1 Tax=Novacetimonas hansenii ATCC 23769 TaxID=714995 RepID=D5QCJ7_NOVHA|nr:hypothetical protein GXY_04252 [Novacetimonas hansenii ATCC 23769]GBQ61166.1 hypothetical protein AA0243_2577 [Novacetimonas hansenii NRIC 0243]
MPCAALWSYEAGNTGHGAMNPYPVGIGMTHVSEGTNAASDVVEDWPCQMRQPGCCDNITDLS